MSHLRRPRTSVSTSPDRPSCRRRLLLALPAAVVVLLLVGCHPGAGSSTGLSRAATSGLTRQQRQGEGPGELPRPPRGVQQAALDTAGGQVPDGVTVFDGQYPAVARLDPALLSALRPAATAAAGDGVQVYVDSGWRSRAYQEQLFQKAVAAYGSADGAAQWVARPGTSAHEAGRAVDLGPSDATEWLSQHGAGFGLCQIYGNEPWHYELRPEAVTHGCPAMYADPTQDPRMQ